MKFKTLVLIVLLMCTIMLTGCIKPYDTPEYQEIKNYETAFLIPLEGKTSKQAKFASEEYLIQNQVATKRVRIPHREISTGRMYWNIKHVGTHVLLKVDRRPVTREWVAEANKGTSRRDDAIWVESKDSVGFSVGFTITGMVEPDKSAKFLFNYPANSLAIVMDTEARARVQSQAATISAIYDMDELRSKKQEIIDAVRADVIPYYAERGITITAIGMFGGFTYENPKIQEAIDNVFAAQQEVNVEQAKSLAQDKTNDRIIKAAEAEAKRIQRIAKAEAEKIRTIAKATGEAQSNPLFYKLKVLDLELARVAKWSGEYPKWYMPGGNSPSLLMSMPQE